MIQLFRSSDKMSRSFIVTTYHVHYGPCELISNRILLVFDSYMHRPIMSGPGLYDPTTIMSAQQMNLITREGWVKLLFYLISFFYYIFGMIQSLIVAS